MKQKSEVFFPPNILESLAARKWAAIHTSSLNLDSLLIDGKQTVLSFFLHGSFVLKYADSSNQRDYFLHVLLVNE